MSAPSFTVSVVDWSQAESDIHAVRDTVFVGEMGIPPDLEWDDADRDCVHVLACDAQGAPIGTGRLLASGQIGRMAVLKAWRGQGVGMAMLKTLLTAAHDAHITEMWLHAQQSVVAFYREAGFTEVGNTFVSAGIPHQKMVLTLV